MTVDGAGEAWPTEVCLLAGRRALRITFEDGRSATLPAELLRCESPSAEVQGHSPVGRKLVPGRRDVTIAAVEPVGNYAVRLRFDDGHATGIYGWSLLRTLGHEPGDRIVRYRAELVAAGLSHEPGPTGP